MTDPTTPTLEVKYGTVHYGRTVNDGNYGKTEAAVFVPFVYNDEGDNDAAIQAAFVTAKLIVCDELGLKSKVDDTGVVREDEAIANVTAAFPGTTVAPAAPQQPAPQASYGGGAPSGGTSPYKVFKRITDENGEKIGNPPWFEAQVQAANAKQGANETEFWDNRARLPEFGGDGNPKAPWFKGKNNGDVAVWPPR
jgi:hypothetical protein